MKKITLCKICDKAIRLNFTYTAELEVASVSMLMGEKKYEKIVGRICADCAYGAGYKVRKELLKND